MRRCFLVNFAKFFRTPFLQNKSGKLLPETRTTFMDAVVVCCWLWKVYFMCWLWTVFLPRNKPKTENVFHINQLILNKRAPEQNFWFLVTFPILFQSQYENLGSNFTSIFYSYSAPRKMLWTEAATCNFIKKETLAQVFSCEFCEIAKEHLFYRTSASDSFYMELFWTKIKRLSLE